MDDSDDRQTPVPEPSFISSPLALTFKKPALPAKSDDLDGIRTIVGNMKADINLVETLLTQHTLPVQPPTSHRPQSRPFNPEGIADSKNAIFLQNAFENLGVVGLVRAARVLAKMYMQDLHIKPSKNYEVIDGNEDDEIEFIHILSTMNHTFLTHVLRGDLMWQYFHNREVYRAVTAHHSLKKYPGTYIQAFVRSDVEVKIPDTQSSTSTLAGRRVDNPHAGSWLTGREISIVYQNARKYLPGPNTDKVLAKNIDEFHQGWKAQPIAFYDQGGRRYLNSTNMPKFERWLDVWKTMFMDRIEPLLKAEAKPGDNKLLDIPLRYCPFEIGWGTDVKQRANAHDAHVSSNKLWTFFLALVNEALDRDQTKFMVFRFQTNYLAAPVNAHHLARIADVGQTLIARSEWHQGGFNPVPGGGAGVNDKSLDDNQVWLNRLSDIVYAENSVVTANIKKQSGISDNLASFKAREDNQAQKIKEQDDKKAVYEYRLNKANESVQRIEGAIVLTELQRLSEEHKEQKKAKLKEKLERREKDRALRGTD